MKPQYSNRTARKHCMAQSLCHTYTQGCSKQSGSSDFAEPLFLKVKKSILQKASNKHKY